MRQQNPWTTGEYRTLSEAFAANPNVSPDELCGLLPRHTSKSIEGKWVELGLSRPEGAKRHKPGWKTISELIQRTPLSRQDIADRLGCTRANVQMTLATMRAHWHIAGYRPSGHYAVMVPLIAWGAGVDASYPKKSSRRPTKPVSPFSAAAGLIKAPKGNPGRVYIHLTDSGDNDYAEAA